MPKDNSFYLPASIEPKWQAFWETHKTFAAHQASPLPKYYVLDMFPYPSGAGLHIGHPEGYTASDILARYKKSCGYNVLHPMGWDAFGLPAEQYAIKTGTHPSETTRENINNFRAQIKRIGFAIDWDREINTTAPEYYRWTQWIFLNLFRKGLVSVEEKPVWWCPELRSVLANEEVIDGKSEVGKFPVERKNLRQVVLRITAHADRLLSGLKDLDWPDSTKRMQEAWIGRSTGAIVKFSIEDRLGESLEVFTTRPDTLFGVTYMVAAPEHPILDSIVTAEQRPAVNHYLELTKRKSDLDRTDLAREKSGVFTGAYARNPLSDERIPIWTADYVLASYGTGAIMAVPAHDQRDFEFATTFDLHVIPVVLPDSVEVPSPTAGSPAPTASEAPPPQLFTGKGTLVNSGSFDGLTSDEAKERIIAALEAKGLGTASVNYRLRDWVFSRQRYWGEPMPLLWIEPADYLQLLKSTESALLSWLPDQPTETMIDGEQKYAIPVPPELLPLRLPEIEDFQPAGNGESPLANDPDWVHVYVDLQTGHTTPVTAGKPDRPGLWVRARRETNTMPQWAGSCWYHLRYMDPHNEEAPVSFDAQAYWQTPDFYIGGAEHAVLHLLYARFWHQVLFDCGVVSSPEPYTRLFHQGIILGEDGEKMSKSRGNVVNPDVIIDEFGADALRLFEMFLGPLEAMKPWNPQGIEGVNRFLRRVWRLIVDEHGHSPAGLGAEDSEATLKLLHQTIAKVTGDIEGLRFNTAISQMMILVNHLHKESRYSRATATSLIQLLAPFAPHLGEELWEHLGYEPSVAAAPWPTADPQWLVLETTTYAIQVNGKLRAQLETALEAPRDEVLSQARALEKIQSILSGKTLRKEIFVPGKIVNFVVTD